MSLKRTSSDIIEISDSPLSKKVRVPEVIVLDAEDEEEEIVLKKEEPVPMTTAETSEFYVKPGEKHPKWHYPSLVCQHVNMDADISDFILPMRKVAEEGREIKEEKVGVTCADVLFVVFWSFMNTDSYIKPELTFAHYRESIREKHTAINAPVELDCLQVFDWAVSNFDSDEDLDTSLVKFFDCIRLSMVGPLEDLVEECEFVHDCLEEDEEYIFPIDDMRDVMREMVKRSKEAFAYFFSKLEAEKKRYQEVSSSPDFAKKLEERNEVKKEMCEAQSRFINLRKKDPKNTSKIEEASKEKKEWIHKFRDFDYLIDRSPAIEESLSSLVSGKLFYEEPEESENEDKEEVVEENKEED